MSQNSTTMSTEQTPGSMPLDQVTASIKGSLLDIWQHFIEHTPYLVGGLVVVLLTWMTAALINKSTIHLLSRASMRYSLRKLILRFINIGVWLLGLLLAAMVVFPGLTPTKALGGLGIVSIAVGLAFKDIFENFFAGILILWRFPFEEGDFIECEGILGQVEVVMIRMTQIRKTTGELVIVPNSFLFKNPVNVLTNHYKRRITIMAGIAYGENIGKAVSVITEAVKKCETVTENKPIEIFPQAFGASSIDIEVTWWTGSKPQDIRRSRGEVVTAVKSALDDAGIEIPFPYRTLTFKEPLAVAIKPKSD